jgi:hypothetical protein
MAEIDRHEQNAGQLETDQRNGLGLATVGIVTIKKDVVTSSDFLAGKDGNPTAADKVVRQIWSDKKTEQLQEHLDTDSVFLTMPSTTRTNIIPVQLAKYLSQETGRPWLNGDNIFNAEHNAASKNIPRDKRIFNARLFSTIDKRNTDKLKNKKVVIVDDIITSGSSIRNLAEFLRNQEINVTHAIGLMGDRRLEIDQKTENKLKELLKQKGIEIDFDTINYITRMEAGGLIRLINNARNDNAIQKITRNLQRVQRHGIIKNTERTPRADWDQGAKGENQGNVGTRERVQTYPSASGIEWQLEFIRRGVVIKYENVSVPAELDKTAQLQRISKLAQKIVAKSNLGAVQVKFKETGKTVSLQRGKDNKKSFER